MGTRDHLHTHAHCILAHRIQPEVICNEELQRHVQEKLVGVKPKLWKWKKHTLRRYSSAIDRQALSWNPPQCRTGSLLRMTKGQSWKGGKDLEWGQDNNCRDWWHCYVEALHFKVELTGTDLTWMKLLTWKLLQWSAYYIQKQMYGNSVTKPQISMSEILL